MLKTSNYKKSIFGLFLLLLLANPAGAQQIITDGFTNTTLNAQGATTNVTTTTIKGTNAFNSFSKFNVDGYNTVNLVVPSNTTNLINIVKGEQSIINGTLQSVKDGKVGAGNIYLVNPNGIMFNSGGYNSGTATLNVGSLTAVTATQAFVDSFFDSPGNPNANHVKQLLEGKAPVNPSGCIESKQGIFHFTASEYITFDAGTINLMGLNSNITITPPVNTDKLTNGNIIFKSANGTNIGWYNTEISTQGAPGIDGGNIIFSSPKDITLSGISLNTNGIGDNSNGGDITIKNNTPGLHTIDFNCNMNASGGGANSNGGDIKIESISLVKPAGKFLTNGGSSNSNGGNISITSLDISGTGDLKIDAKGGTISGNGGNVNFSVVNSMGSYESWTIDLSSTAGIGGAVKIESEKSLGGTFYITAGSVSIEAINNITLSGDIKIQNAPGSNEKTYVTGENITINQFEVDNLYLTALKDINKTGGLGELTARNNAVIQANNLTLGFLDSVDNSIVDVNLTGNMKITNEIEGDKATFNLNVPDGSIDVAFASEVKSLNTTSGGNTRMGLLDVQNAVINSGGEFYSIQVDLNETVNINARGNVTIDGGNRNTGDLIITTSPLAPGGTANINLGVSPLGGYTVEFDGSISASTSNGNITYFKGKTGENLNITASNGNFILGASDVTDSNNNFRDNKSIFSGTANITADKNVTIINTTFNGDLNVNSDTLTFDYGTANAKFNVSAPNGITLGLQQPLNLNGDTSILSYNGNVLYYQGNVAKDLTVTAGNIVNIGNTNHAGNMPINYKGVVSDINHLPFAIPQQDSPFQVVGNLTIYAGGYVDVQGHVIGNYDITTGNDVTINEIDAANINQVAGANVDITAAMDGIYDATAGELPNIMANNVNLHSIDGSIGTFEEDFNIQPLANSNLITLNAQAAGNIIISQDHPSCNLGIHNVQSNNGSVVLFSDAGILDANPQETANISGHDIVLVAIQGSSIGTYDNPIDINLKGGLITAQGYGFINLIETTGDMNINLISNAGRGDIYLSTLNGNVLNASQEYASIIGKNLKLNAVKADNNSYAGEWGNALDIDSSGTLTGTADNAFINESTGDVIPSNLNAKVLLLTAPGSILSSNSNNPDIQSSYMYLNAQNGTIGTSTNYLKICQIPVANNQGVLNAAANGSIYISENSTQPANLYLGSVTSLNSDIFINSNAGILDSGSGESANLTAKNITLIATNTSSIGSYSEPVGINLQGGSVHAQGFGYIGLNELNGDLVVDLVSNAGRNSVSLNALNGNIIDTALNHDNPCIISKGLTMNSPKGAIDIDVNSNYQNKGGTLSATAAKQIAIYHTDDSMSLININNNKNDTVKIISEGPVFNGSAIPQILNINAKNIELTSLDDIGTKDKLLNVSISKDGYFQAKSNGPLNINHNVNLPFYVKNLNSNNNPIILNSLGGIYSYPPGHPLLIPIITGSSLKITSNTAIGTIADPVVVDIKGPVNAYSPDTHIIKH